MLPISLMIATKHDELSNVTCVLLPSSQVAKHVLLSGLLPISPYGGGHDWLHHNHLQMQHHLHIEYPPITSISSATASLRGFPMITPRSSYTCEISIYERLLIILQREVIAFYEIVLYNFHIVLCLVNSYRSHFHVRRVFEWSRSGLWRLFPCADKRGQYRDHY